MNTKKYMLPAFVAVSALMFVAASPYVLAESSEDRNWENRDANDRTEKSYKGHRAVLVEGFTGSIPVPDMSDIVDKKTVYTELKSQVTVKLSEAATLAEDAGLDVTKGKLGKAVDENGNKYLVWKIIEKNKDAESDIVNKTIFIVDAADSSNTAQVTKEYDRSKYENRDDDHESKRDAHSLSDPEKIENKIGQIEKKLNEGNLSPEQADNKIQFVYILRQLQTAIADGNDAQADSLREQLQEIRNQMINLKKFR